LFNDQTVYRSGFDWVYPDINLMFSQASHSIVPFGGTPKGGTWQFRYSYELASQSGSYLATVFVSAGTPIWNRTYANVSIPAMKFYTWHV